MTYRFSNELGVSNDYFDVNLTPSTNFTSPIRMFYVGNGGDVNCLPPSGGARVIFRNLSQGYHQFGVVQISNVGTTASNIVGFL